MKTLVATYKRQHPDADEKELTHFLQAQLTKRAEGYKQELLAVYPIPEDKVQIMIRPKLDPDAEMRGKMVVVAALGAGGKFRLLGGGDAVDGDFPDSVDGDARTILQTKLTYSQMIKEIYPESDAIVLVTTNGFEVKGTGISVEGWTPDGVEGVHYIDESYDPPDELSVAHEIGHQDRFLGSRHWFNTWTPHPVTLDDLQDGWNAGQHLHDMSTAMHSFDLMADGKTEGRRRFIIVKEYKKLLEVMVAGGADPLLLNLNGVLGSDGKVLLTPLRLSMGKTPEKITGPGALVFNDATGKSLGAWNFPIIAADSDSKWQKFATQVPVPANAANVTLQLPGGFLQKLDFPKIQPEIAWHDVQYDPAKAVLHATFTLKGDAAQSYLASFAYQSDRQGSFDLPDAQSRLSPGDHTVDISLADVPQSDHAKIKLTVTKDLAFAQAISSEFAVPNHPPQVYIETVFDQADKPRKLHSIVYDLQDQFNVETTWSDGPEKSLSKDRDLSMEQIKALGIGTHDIILHAKDTAGAESIDHLQLQVKESGDVVLIEPRSNRVWIISTVGVLLAPGIAFGLIYFKRRRIKS